MKSLICLTIVALTILAVACGGGGSDPTGTFTPAPTPGLTFTPAPTPTAQYSDLRFASPFPPCEPAPDVMEKVGHDPELYQQWIFRIGLGFRETDAGVVTPVRDESLMITGDLNMVDVQAVVFYRVKNLDGFVSKVDSLVKTPRQPGARWG